MACMRNGFDQGKLLGERFLTISPLNHGSFGMVFTAKDIETGADVAVKCITKPEAVTDDTNCPAAIAIDDRSEELDIHSNLPAHPNIVNLICNFETKHHQYMVLELCSNGDLYEAIRVGRGPLETEHVRSFMLELVDAIDHLHANGVFHRDIKPENIFLTNSGSMKLGDFGLATTETWSTEFAVGSDRYMAPEQFDASVYGYGYSPASADIWAIGIVLLNVLFQRNPFATPTPKDPLFNDFVRDRQSLFDVFPNMSQDTFNVIVHSLALDPANRSLSAVREAIKAVVSFTTDDEALDDFCTEQQQNELVPVATAAREPLRTPSITSPNMSGGEAFPWATALLQTPQKATRQLSTIPDNEPELFPGSFASAKLYGDTDEVSLSSQVDSGLGMSYKSAKSVKSAKQIIGSLPINFSRPGAKSSRFSNVFSKSWSDLYDEDEEEELEREEQAISEAGPADMERVPTAKPATPQIRSVIEDDRGSATPRPTHAVPALPGHIDDDHRTASPLRRLVEEDRANPESTKQRTASIMDRWSALGHLRRAKADAVAPTVTLSNIPPPPPVPKSRYADAFASFSPFGSSNKKQKSRPRTAHDDGSDWRQASPQRLRSTSINRSRVWERKEQSPAQEKWSLDNNWRQHMSPAVTTTSGVPPAQKSPSKTSKTEKSFLDLEFDDGIGDLLFGMDMAGHDDDVEWNGSGWHHDFL